MGVYQLSGVLKYPRPAVKYPSPAENSLPSLSGRQVYDEQIQLYKYRQIGHRIQSVQISLYTDKMAPSAIDTTSSTLASYRGYDHIHWYVGNAKQAASYYITRMNFKRIAYRGLETGHKTLCSHVIRNGDITFILTSPLRSLEQVDADETEKYTKKEREQLRAVVQHLEQHGDAVKDVAFEVDSVREVFGAAVKGGAEVVAKPWVEEDKDGSVFMATVQTYGQTTHTLLERGKYRGAFLPGYRLEGTGGAGVEDPICRLLPGVHLNKIDHCVGNQDWNEMDKICE